MKHLLYILLSFSSLMAADVSILIDLTTSEHATIQRRLLAGVKHAVEHYAKEGKTSDVAVVIHGGAYKFFLHSPANSIYKDDETLLTRHTSLKRALETFIKEYPVHFEVCSQGMKDKRITKEDLYTFVKPIPSAMTGLVDWQQKGYAYTPID